MFKTAILIVLTAAWCAAAVKGLPIADYNSDNGFGYGVHLGLSGASDTAAVWRLTTEFYATTGGVLQPMVNGDITLASGIRIRGKAMYDRTLYTGYYGYGNTDEEIAFDKSFNNDYGYVYRRTNPYTYLTVTVPVGPVPALGWFAGAGLAYYGIDRSPEVPGGGTEPKLFSDAPEGVDGGMLYRILGGAVFDTRDYEYNARKGVYAETAFEFGVLDKAYTRVTVTVASYVVPVKAWPRVVFAGRALYDQLNGAPPFFVQEKTGGINPQDGIGGSGTMRGIPQYRYKGNVKLIVTPELRMRIASVKAGSSQLHLENVFFADAGNVWQDAGAMRLPLHVTYGFGPKFLWGEDFIVSACFGFWRNELTGVYVNTGHQF